MKLVTKKILNEGLKVILVQKDTRSYQKGNVVVLTEGGGGGQDKLYGPSSILSVEVEDEITNQLSK